MSARQVIYAPRPARPARLYETRATLRRGLCVCASCIAAFPARAAMKTATAAAVRARVNQRAWTGEEGGSP